MYYNIKNNKCVDCEKRKIGCHVYCEDYKKYRQHIEMISEQKREFNKNYVKHRKRV